VSISSGADRELRDPTALGQPTAIPPPATTASRRAVVDMDDVSTSAKSRKFSLWYLTRQQPRRFAEEIPEYPG